MTVVNYKLETFEGPLDLLLHLIDKAEIDIQDIPISDITDQYMAFCTVCRSWSWTLQASF